jgi:4-amino-4-deoxy-L-arabinose transferase-like glycosyltransferase
LLFTLSFSIGLYSIRENRQLGYLSGLSEGYLRYGTNLQKNGSFYWEEGVPFVFRPPGYIFFIASVLECNEFVLKVGQTFNIALATSPKRALMTSQAVLLALSSCFLFLWMGIHFAKSVSFVVAALFGCNPYMLVLIGMYHYDILHVFLTIVSCYCTSLAIERDSKRKWPLFAAGVLWGITTLTRPMTLLLPVFALGMFLIKNRFVLRKSAIQAGLLTLGILIVVAPYTVRNYVVSGDFIPVNSQSGTALWSGTVKKMEANPNRYRWWDIWYKYGTPVSARVTGNPKYNYSEYVANSSAINKEFFSEALANIEKQPDIYFHNVWNNFISFNIHINGVYVSCFEHLKKPGTRLKRKDWFSLNPPKVHFQSLSEKVFEYLTFGLTILSLLAVAIAIRNRDTSILVASAAYLCFCFSHSVTYLEMMYYYIKMPFLFYMAGYSLNEGTRLKISLLFSKMTFSASQLLLIPMIGCTVFMVANVIF